MLTPTNTNLVATLFLYQKNLREDNLHRELGAELTYIYLVLDDLVGRYPLPDIEVCRHDFGLSLSIDRDFTEFSFTRADDSMAHFKVDHVFYEGKRLLNEGQFPDFIYYDENGQIDPNADLSQLMDDLGYCYGLLLGGNILGHLPARAAVFRAITYKSAVGDVVLGDLDKLVPSLEGGDVLDDLLDRIPEIDNTQMILFLYAHYKCGAELSTDTVARLALSVLDKIYAQVRRHEGKGVTVEFVKCDSTGDRLRIAIGDKVEFTLGYAFDKNGRGYDLNKADICVTRTDVSPISGRYLAGHLFKVYESFFNTSLDRISLKEEYVYQHSDLTRGTKHHLNP